MTELPIFCKEQLTDYEKTIFSMAIDYGKSYSCIKITDNDVSAIATLLGVDYGLLHKAINFYNSEIIGGKRIKIGNENYSVDDFQNGELFYAIFRIYLIYKQIGTLTDSTSFEATRDNYNIINACISEFHSLNASVSTFECMSQNYFSLDFAVFNNTDYSPRMQLNLIQNFLANEQKYIFDKTYLPFFWRIMAFELITRLNAIYLIIAVQIIRYSIFMSEQIKRIAYDVYHSLLDILQNACIISVQTNFLPPLASNTPKLRGKKENTTRLQILFSFANYDSYYLRFDLAHKGQKLIHYNNKSPGEIKCCLFHKDEYNAIISKNPLANKFFIKYNNCYGLKELCNLELSSKEKALYENIRVTNEHKQVFETHYDEKDVVYFINMISYILPSACCVCLDTSEEHANHCFHYNKIMFNATLLHLAILSKNKLQIQKITDLIVRLAVKYNLIDSKHKNSFTTIEDLCLILDEARDKIDIYKIHFS